MALSSVVHKDQPHMIYRGDSMERKYDATYTLGKTTVCVVAPPPMTEGKKEQNL